MSDLDDYRNGRALATEATRGQAIRHALPLLEVLADVLKSEADFDRQDTSRRLQTVITDLRSAL